MNEKNSEKIYVKPEMEITEFETEDVITTSDPTSPVIPETPEEPF